ncbi:hypothetical protein [Methylophaga sp.]|uniref:hypothetical protein n=1 Tax=Methylophaga sp. TaxID=2024840 RepID=UPI003A921294
MEFDEEYKERLLAPLKKQVGVKISAYLDSLKKSKISVENKGVVDEKFITHFQQLVREGAIINSSGYNTLESFGIEVGTNNHIIYWDCSDISVSRPVKRSTIVSNTINIQGSYTGNLQAGLKNELRVKHKKNLFQRVLAHICKIMKGF